MTTVYTITIVHVLKHAGPGAQQSISTKRQSRGRCQVRVGVHGWSTQPGTGHCSERAVNQAQPAHCWGALEARRGRGVGHRGRAAEEPYREIGCPTPPPTSLGYL